VTGDTVEIRRTECCVVATPGDGAGVHLKDASLALLCDCLRGRSRKIARGRWQYYTERGRPCRTENVSGSVDSTVLGTTSVAPDGSEICVRRGHSRDGGRDGSHASGKTAIKQIINQFQKLKLSSSLQSSFNVCACTG